MTIEESRKEILEFLRDTQAYFGSYHNHKESSAWAGIVLYCVVLVNLIDAIEPQISSPSFTREKLWITLGVGLGAVICSMYIRGQLALRKRAADVVAACIRLRSEIISDPSTPLDPAEWAPREAGKGGLQSGSALPKKVIEAADRLAPIGQWPRRMLELCAYVFLSIISAAMVWKIWMSV